MIKIIHNRKLCNGCGTCAVVCPSLFEMSEKEQKANLKNSKEMINGSFELDTDDIECAKEAADICGSEAIKMVS